MAKPLLPDDLWDIVNPLLPVEKPKPKGGRPRVPDRATLTGIFFVLKSGIPWEMLPIEMGCGSGVTCWRRLREWQETGVWDRIWRTMLDRLGCQKRINWDWAALDASYVRAVGGGDKAGPNPTDRAKAGSKRHLITDGAGIPLALSLTAANVHDTQPALALVDAIPPIRGNQGRPRRRPGSLFADRGYDADWLRDELEKRRIDPFIAERGTEHGSGFGVFRWVVERTFGWLNQFRRLRVRYERRADIHQAFLVIGCTLICWKRLAEEF